MSTCATYSKSWDAERLDTAACAAHADEERLPELLLEAARMIRCRVSAFPPHAGDLLDAEDAPGEMLPWVLAMLRRWEPARGGFSKYLWHWAGLRWARIRSRRISQRTAATSLDAPTGDDSLPLADLLADPAALLPWEAATSRVRIPTDVLSEIERQTLELRYGLTSREPMSCADIARELGRYPQYYQQVELRALAKLRSELRFAVKRAATALPAKAVKKPSSAKAGCARKPSFDENPFESLSRLRVTNRP